MKKSHIISSAAFLTACIALSLNAYSTENQVANDAASVGGVTATAPSSSNTMKAVHAIESAFKKTAHTEVSPISNSEFNNIVNQGVSSQSLKLALKAYQWAEKKGELNNKRYLTIVDFSQPSTSKRMHVVDLNTGKVVFNELVTQGHGSGTGKMATRFSDTNGSHASVLGAIVTQNTYFGKHGYSLRLNGLESINKNVRDRAIVVHSANYATENFAEANGRLGTSWGCFAVSPSVSKEIIETIKNGSLIFAYAPQINNDSNYA